MFGILLAGLTAGFEEITASIGKKKISLGDQSYSSYGFLTQATSALAIAAVGIAMQNFIFSPASLPTFVPRTLIAIVQIHLMIIALSKVDRGNFGLLRLATLPLLLLADTILGYALSSYQIVGIFLISAPIVLAFTLEESNRAKWLLLLVSVLAAADISLYKYDISHFNSVTGEQAIIFTILAIYFLAISLLRRENPFRLLKEPIYLLQTGTFGLGALTGSFSYLFAPASVIATAFRGFSVLFAILSGRLYFKEGYFRLRIVLFLVICIGLVLLVL